MKALLPAAGYATRLYPLTKNFPKPLLDVNGKPMIEHIIEKIVELPAVDQIFVVTNDKFYSNFFEWSENFSCSVPLKVLNDSTKSNETRLGSVGDWNFVIEKEKIGSELLCINSDNLFSFSLKGMYDYFKEKSSPVISVYDVGSFEIAKRMGDPQLDENNRVTGFVEKPENPADTLAAIGIYFFTSQAVKLVSKYLKDGNSPDKTGEFIEWLYKQLSVYGFKFGSEHKWFDIGDLKVLQKVREEFSR